uniref:putative signal transducing protein n=1 Tax=Thaumasiovibrio occultus TaxID=1891184 RepID=UPI000B34D638|nr:DUF2007 domain-containing protein [Thaumasiovibrio occultus]
MEDWVELGTASTSTEAHLIRILLAREGITLRIDGAALSGALGELPIEMMQIRLWVHPLQLGKAQRLLESRTDNLPIWFCRHCAEENPGEFSVCWHCGHEMPEL